MSDAREASPGDVPRLVALMAELHAEGGFPLPAAAAARAFDAPLARPLAAPVHAAPVHAAPVHEG